MGRARKPREKLCASAFQPSQTQTNGSRRKKKCCQGLRLSAAHVRPFSRPSERSRPVRLTHFLRLVVIVFLPCPCRGSPEGYSPERVNGLRAKTSRKSMRERVPSLQDSKKGHQKWASSPPTLRAGFSSFGGVERARA